MDSLNVWDPLNISRAGILLFSQEQWSWDVLESSDYRLWGQVSLDNETVNFK